MKVFFGILIACAIIGALIGFFSSDNRDDAGSNALAGALSGCGIGGSCLLRLLGVALVVLLALWLFGAIFGGCD